MVLLARGLVGGGGGPEEPGQLAGAGNDVASDTKHCSNQPAPAIVSTGSSGIIIGTDIDCIDSDTDAGTNSLAAAALSGASVGVVEGVNALALLDSVRGVN